jgi:hypothetical protein
MTLNPSQRSALAERICGRWIRRRGIRLRAPEVHVSHRKRPVGMVWGHAHRPEFRPDRIYIEEAA